MTTENRYRIVREDLHRAYDDQIDPALIDTTLDTAIAEAEATATVTDFLPVTVGRTTIERLEELAANSIVGGLKHRPEILYVSDRNAGRSQFAAALTHHLVGDHVFVRSVGLHSNDEPTPSVLKALRERGISEEGLYDKDILARTVHRADVIVLLGVDETPDVPGDRYVHWHIADPTGRPEAEVNAIADDIDAHVRQLLTEMGVLDSAA